MDSLIEVFHIDVKLLLAQVINFAIVISVLYFFMLKPLLGTMKERTDKIEKSLQDADSIDEKMKKMEEEYAEALKNAKREAALIMEQANKDAEEKREKMTSKAKEEIGVIINEEKAKMQREKAQVLKEIRADVAELVSLSMERILEQKGGELSDREMIGKMIKKND